MDISPHIRSETAQVELQADCYNTNELINTRTDETLENCKAVIRFLSHSALNECRDSDGDRGHCMVLDMVYNALRFETEGRGDFEREVEKRAAKNQEYFDEETAKHQEPWSLERLHEFRQQMAQRLEQVDAMIQEKQAGGES